MPFGLIGNASFRPGLFQWLLCCLLGCNSVQGHWLWFKEECQSVPIVSVCELFVSGEYLIYTFTVFNSELLRNDTQRWQLLNVYRFSMFGVSICLFLVYLNKKWLCFMLVLKMFCFLFTVLQFPTPPFIVSPVQPTLSFVFMLPLNARVKLEFQQSLPKNTLRSRIL